MISASEDDGNPSLNQGKIGLVWVLHDGYCHHGMPITIHEDVILIHVYFLFSVIWCFFQVDQKQNRIIVCNKTSGLVSHVQNQW